MSGGIVEQGHASLLKPRTRCGEDAGPASRTAGVSRLVVVGSPWRVSLDNPSCRTFLQRTRVHWELFDYSNGPRTVSNANLSNVTARLQWGKSAALRAVEHGRAAFSSLRSALSQLMFRPWPRA